MVIAENGLALVVMLDHCEGNIPGEVCGFLEEHAQQMIEAGRAMAYEEPEPEE